jgi:hypothetical protein
LDEVVGIDDIACQTSRVPPKFGQDGFDIPVQNGFRGTALSIEDNGVAEDRSYPLIPRSVSLALCPPEGG